MSPIASALHHRFEEVCRAELQRLRRKTAALTPAEREAVDRMSVEVTQAIAARVGAAVTAGGSDVADVVERLFAVTGATARANG